MKYIIPDNVIDVDTVIVHAKLFPIHHPHLLPNILLLLIQIIKKLLLLNHM